MAPGRASPKVVASPLCGLRPVPDSTTVMARILALSSPAPGHVLPIAPGLRALADRGHDVVLVADERSLELVSALELRTVALDPRIAAIEVDDHLAEKDLDRLSRGLARLMERGAFEREPDIELPEAIPELREHRDDDQG